MLGQPHALGAGYRVTLPAFQGPLELLLQLIEKHELDISEISLVAVTDQYLEAIREMQQVEPAALADFLVVASRLLWIKSTALLPKAPAGEEDEEESADGLIRRLLEYRRFKEAAERLRAREEAGLRAYPRTAAPPAPERRLDRSSVDLGKLQDAVRRALARIPSDPPLPQVRAYPITVAEQIDVVRSRMAAARRTAGGAAAAVLFSDLLAGAGTRLELIVTFLAVLELIKQQELVAVQESVFGEIALTPAG